INKDGNTDVVATGFAPGRVVKGAGYGGGDLTLWNSYINVLLGNGDGSFQVKTTTNLVKDSLYAAAPVAVGDFTSDGRLDVLVGTVVPNKKPDPHLQNVSLRAGRGDGTLAKLGVVAPGVGVFMIPADFNADGRLDFVAGYAVYLGNGDG